MKTLIEEVETLQSEHGKNSQAYTAFGMCLALIRKHESGGGESEYAIVYDTKHGAFWCPGSAGYTADHREAGAYRIGEIAKRNATLSCRYLIPYPIGTNLADIPRTHPTKKPDDELVDYQEIARNWMKKYHDRVDESQALHMEFLEFMDDVAKALGIKIGTEKYWDTPVKERKETIINRAKKTKSALGALSQKELER